MNKQQRAAVMASHDPRIAEFADRVFHLQDGVIRSAESPQSK